MAAAGPIRVSYSSVYTHTRIRVLAEPKQVAYESSPRLEWGNQETIWPLSWGAMTSRPSSRITLLSKSKKDFCEHQRSYRSVIGGRPLLVKFAYPSERLLKLAEPKKLHPASLQQRSPEWPVSLSALTYNASPRILELARPKLLHPEFIPPREVPTQVPTPATLASASSRLERLAEPCVRFPSQLSRQLRALGPLSWLGQRNCILSTRPRGILSGQCQRLPSVQWLHQGLWNWPSLAKGLPWAWLNST
ncbi:testicular haploid expressed gene protein-like isoform X2 [Pipra filicauda]|uniref:Testicular haploid expressed gene protein-like isoform X2 n=1 Tax=Pipra filicauda TaxID=649802 RepID=A0A7R5KDW6_9PASS|nr:testicular haploid expressed gene protein-like isoform X2 [Pipra filicauda]